MANINEPRPSQRLFEKETLRQALRWVEAGHTLAEAEQVCGVPSIFLERALVHANTRQDLIRHHLQSRPRLTSLLRYPARGPWGQSSYTGNCSGYLIVDLLDYFKPRSVFDPMEGSGTTGDVCFDFKVEYVGCDLQAGFDLLSSPFPDQPFELVFWHPPYWPGHHYSRHPNDFSRIKKFGEYLTAMHAGFTRLSEVVAPQGHLVILIGDGRKQGTFFPIHNEIIHWRLLPLDAVLIKEGDHNRRGQFFRYGPTPFIPTLHEYVLIFKKGAS